MRQLLCRHPAHGQVAGHARLVMNSAVLQGRHLRQPDPAVDQGGRHQVGDRRGCGPKPAGRPAAEEVSPESLQSLDPTPIKLAAAGA